MKLERDLVRMPAALLAVLLLSFPLGMIIAASTQSRGWGRVGFLGPFFISLAVWRASLHQRRHGTASPSEEFGTVGPAGQRPETVGGAWLIGFSALFSALVVVIGGTYLGQFWFIALTGLAALIGFWGQRSADNFRGALAFVGIFVAIYGVLGVAVQVLSR